MKGLRLMLLITLMVGFLDTIYTDEVLSSDKDICRLFKDGVKLRQPGSCRVGIICKDSKSIENIVCKNGMVYERNIMKCVKSAPDEYCDAPCVAKSKGYIQDPKNCKGWYNCNGKTVISSGYCPYNLVFNTKNGMCDYPENSSCKATFDFCDVVPNSTPFQNEDHCGAYYECVKQRTKTVLRLVECDAGKYFDVKTATCVPKNQVNCSKYPYPKEVCGNTKLAIRGHFVGDGASCRGYFYCKDLGVGAPDSSPNWGQCPATTFFDPEEEACKLRINVRCVEDRCDGRDDGYELSSKAGCMHYLVCKNNRTVEERYCGDGMWFDAATEKCTSTRKSYPACD